MLPHPFHHSFWELYRKTLRRGQKKTRLGDTAARVYNRTWQIEVTSLWQQAPHHKNHKSVGAKLVAAVGRRWWGEVVSQADPGVSATDSLNCQAEVLLCFAPVPWLSFTYNSRKHQQCAHLAPLGVSNKPSLAQKHSVWHLVSLTFQCWIQSPGLQRLTPRSWVGTPWRRWKKAKKASLAKWQHKTTCNPALWRSAISPASPASRKPFPDHTKIWDKPWNRWDKSWEKPWDFQMAHVARIVSRELCC